MDSLESVQHFIDDYLGYLYELRPTAASFDGPSSITSCPLDLSNDITRSFK